MASPTSTATAHAFHLEVITPERTVVDKAARSLVAPAEDGMLGVLPNHAPMVTALAAGVFTFTAETGEKSAVATGAGFLEVVSNHVRVLVDTAERPDQIDVARARAARERATERLARRGNTEIDVVRAEAALRRAIARLKATNSF